MRVRRILILGACVSALFVGASSPAHALLACAPSDDCPVANDDLYITAFNTTLNVAAPGVMRNDQGVAGTTVDVQDSDTDSLGGAAVTLHPNGSFTYKPDPTNPFSGIDEFDYWIQDKDGTSDFATAYIAVNAVMTDETYYTTVNQAVSVPAPGIWANDTGLDLGTDTFDTTNAASHGTIAVHDDGSFQFTPTTDFSGTASFTYTAWDYNQDNLYTGTTRIKIDSTPPSGAAITTPTDRTTLTPTFAVGWTATDTIAGVGKYDVQIRVAPWNGVYTAWANWKTGTTAKTATYSGNPGRTYCFRVRAYDRSGNVSAWSVQKCTAIPLNAPQLTYGTGWSTQTRGDVYGGALRVTTTNGAHAGVTAAQAKYVFLVATKCSTCGVVQVKWNSTVTATINLSSATTLRKQVIQIVKLGGVQTANLTITVTSPTGKSVQIEGLTVSRN